MTTEEYQLKIKELRKERDFHQKEADRLMKEMDELCIDLKYLNWTIGNFIKIDKRSKGGYLDYFHVDSYDKRPRGVVLYGKGFNVCNYIIHINETLTIYFEDGDANLIEEITEEEFYKAFDEYVEIIKNRLYDVKNYESLGDQFLFKNSLMNSKLIMEENKGTLNIN